jgi:hypothetical protein
MKMITILVVIVKTGPGPGPRRPASGPRVNTAAGRWVPRRAGPAHLSALRTQAVNIL